MSRPLNSKQNAGEHRPDTAVRRPRLLLILAVVIALEAAAATLVVGWLVVELLTVVPYSLSSAVGVLLLAVCLAVGLWTLVVGTLRARSWTRGATLTWQLLQIAIAIGCFQGVFAVPALGWALIAPAVVAILLLLTPSVVGATRRASA